MSSHHRTNNPYAAAAGGVNKGTTTPPPEQQQQNTANSSEAATTQQQQQQQQQQGTNAGGNPQTPNLLNIPEQYHETTLHKPLIGHVSFVPYPKTEVAFANNNPVNSTTDPAEPTQRIFIGQLPYGVTEMQLQWMTQLFGGGVFLLDPEVIIKNNKKTGCIHARVKDSQLKQVVAGMHKRILVDDSGVWVGRTPQEIQVLTQYVAELKADPKKRYPDRPYDTVVVQNATSERQQFHQGLPTLEDFFQQQSQQFAASNGMYQ